MLRRNKRIQGRQRVAEIIQKPDFETKSRLFVIKKKANKLPHDRFAVVVSKKIHKSAVKRNKVRRQVYESIRLLLQKNAEADVQEPTHSDMILLARTPVQNASFDDIFKAVQQLLNKAHE